MWKYKDLDSARENTAESDFDKMMNSVVGSSIKPKLNFKNDSSYGMVKDTISHQPKSTSSPFNRIDSIKLLPNLFITSNIEDTPKLCDSWRDNFYDLIYSRFYETSRREGFGGNVLSEFDLGTELLSTTLVGSKSGNYHKTIEALVYGILASDLIKLPYSSAISSNKEEQDLINENHNNQNEFTISRNVLFRILHKVTLEVDLFEHTLVLMNLLLSGNLFTSSRLQVRTCYSWLLEKLIETNIENTSSILEKLIRNVLPSDQRKINLILIEKILIILNNSKETLFGKEKEKQKFTASIAYWITRLMSDHHRTSNQLCLSLFEKEQILLNEIIDDYSDSLVKYGGRDLLFQLLECRSYDIEMNVRNTIRGFLEKNGNKMITIFTPLKTLLLRISQKMERNLKYLFKSVIGNNYIFYVDWILNEYRTEIQYYNPKERPFVLDSKQESFIVDLIRFIIRGIHPSNETLQSRVVPRYMVLEKLILAPVTLEVKEQSIAALCLDLSFFSKEEKGRSIMNVEPVLILLKYAFSKNSTDIIISIIENLLKITERYDDVKGGLRNPVYHWFILSSKLKVISANGLKSILIGNNIPDVLKQKSMKKFPKFCGIKKDKENLETIIQPTNDKPVELEDIQKQHEQQLEVEEDEIKSGSASSSISIIERMSKDLYDIANRVLKDKADSIKTGSLDDLLNRCKKNSQTNVADIQLLADFLASEIIEVLSNQSIDILVDPENNGPILLFLIKKYCKNPDELYTFIKYFEKHDKNLSLRILLYLWWDKNLWITSRNDKSININDFMLKLNLYSYSQNNNYNGSTISNSDFMKPYWFMDDSLEKLILDISILEEWKPEKFPLVCSLVFSTLSGLGIGNKDLIQFICSRIDPVNSFEICNLLQTASIKMFGFYSSPVLFESLNWDSFEQQNLWILFQSEFNLEDNVYTFSKDVPALMEQVKETPSNFCELLTGVRNVLQNSTPSSFEVFIISCLGEIYRSFSLTIIAKWNFQNYYLMLTNCIELLNELHISWCARNGIENQISIGIESKNTSLSSYINRLGSSEFYEKITLMILTWNEWFGTQRMMPGEWVKSMDLYNDFNRILEPFMEWNSISEKFSNNPDSPFSRNNFKQFQINYSKRFLEKLNKESNKDSQAMKKRRLQ